MTELLYQTDSYQREFQATITVIDAEARAVLLDRSAFYPGGGGQPADSGVLVWQGAALPVERARKGSEGIWHVLAGDAPLPPVGAVVTGQIDWPRRYALMRTHTAMHILCGVVFRDFGALVTGGDMEPLHGRMDFEFESLTKDLVSVIEEAVNREVAAALTKALTKHGVKIVAAAGRPGKPSTLRIEGVTLESLAALATACAKAAKG